MHYHSLTLTIGEYRLDGNIKGGGCARQGCVNGPRTVDRKVCNVPKLLRGNFNVFGLSVETRARSNYCAIAV